MTLQFTVISTWDSQSGSDASDLGVAAIPHNSNQSQSNTIAYANAAMVLTNDPAKQEAIYKFISFLLEPTNYGRFLTMEPGLYLPVTEDGATSTTFWSDKTVVKYKSQIETMIENSKNGMLFGFTNGNTFQSISQISAQNLIAQTLQKVLIDKEPAAQAVAEGQKLMEESIKK
jgi:multiple sugar transport system substrate-binding protein